MLPVAVSGAMAILSPDPPCDAEVISIALHTTDQNLAKECLMPLPHIGSNGSAACCFEILGSKHGETFLLL